MNNHPKISVVIPMYREEENVREMLASVTSVMDATGEPYEVICIDDGSNDGTWENLRKEVNTKKDVKAVRFSRNFGAMAGVLR